MVEKKENKAIYFKGHLVSPCFMEFYKLLSRYPKIERAYVINRLYKEGKAPCDNARGYTLQEIALLIGVSKERARQIEQQAIRKLTHPAVARKLRDYIEF